VYDINRPFETTNSPSMDILISSNLERFLYAISGGNSEVVSDLMHGLKANGKYQINEIMRKNMSDFVGGYASDAEAVETIRSLYEKHGYVLDTHTAVAYKVYADYVRETGDQTQTLIASTASPFKFLDSVAEGLGIDTTSIDAFDLIEVVAKIAGLAIPEPVVGLKDKPVLHLKTIDKLAIKEEVIAIIK
jgi:threonine synthase